MERVVRCGANEPAAPELMQCF